MMLVQALTLQAGYNAALVTLGAAALGAAAGAVGGFLYLRRRALVSDAISHATLPGLALAFLVMVGLGFDGRNLPGLMLGSAASAGLGLWLLARMTRHTRLPEDSAIGAVLSVFFGAGIVLLTVIQTLSSGRQAGLEGFLLGSTAGMLRSDAVMIGLGGLAVLVVLYALRRPLLAAAFDPGHAQVTGLPVRAVDAALLIVALAVTVIGLRLVGLVLIVALLIIPAAAARFWTQDASKMLILAGLFGAGAGYAGAALSASAPGLPTGALIVLSAFALFAASALAAPARGMLAGYLRHVRLRRSLRQREALRAADLTRLSQSAQTERAALALDDRRWRALRARGSHPELVARDSGAVRVADLLSPADLIQLDAELR